jgi:hypothetical protein
MRAGLCACAFVPVRLSPTLTHIQIRFHRLPLALTEQEWVPRIESDGQWSHAVSIKDALAGAATTPAFLASHPPHGSNGSSQSQSHIPHPNPANASASPHPPSYYCRVRVAQTTTPDEEEPPAPTAADLSLSGLTRHVRGAATDSLAQAQGAAGKAAGAASMAANVARQVRTCGPHTACLGLYARVPVPVPVPVPVLVCLCASAEVALVSWGVTARYRWPARGPRAPWQQWPRRQH